MRQPCQFPFSLCREIFLVTTLQPTACSSQRQDLYRETGPPLTRAQRGRPPGVEARLGLHSSDSSDHGPTRHHCAVFFYLGSRSRQRRLPGFCFTGFHVTELQTRLLESGRSPPPLHRPPNATSWARTAHFLRAPGCCHEPRSPQN